MNGNRNSSDSESSSVIEVDTLNASSKGSAFIRSAGFLLSKMWHKHSRSTGNPVTNSLGLGGSRRCFSMKTSQSEPTKGSLPVRASKRITPIAYQSQASVSESPAACSGAMYLIDPAMVPSVAIEFVLYSWLIWSRVIRVDSSSSPTSLIRPKSRSSTRPSPRTIIFFGLMSRCNFPLRCSARTPFTSCKRAVRSLSKFRCSPVSLGAAINAFVSLAVSPISGPRTQVRKSTPSTNSIV